MSALGSGAYLLGTTVTGASDVTTFRDTLGLGFLYSYPSGHLDRPNQPINPGARDPLNLDASNSPTLAVNPTDSRSMAVSNRIDTPRFSCGLHVTHDGGSTWTDTRIAIPAGEEPKCYAPDVAFAPNGRLYLSYVTLSGIGNTPHAVWITSSQDGGTTLAAPRKVLGPLAFQVRLTADRASSDRLYLSWLQASEVGTLLFPSTGNPIELARSDDGGATWRGPIRVTPEQRRRVVAPSTAVAANGTVYVAYLDLRDDVLDYNGAHQGRGGEPYNGRWALVVARSFDRGASWDEATVTDSLVPTERMVVFLPPLPAIATDPQNGMLYVAFQDGRQGSADVYLWTSENQGLSFRTTRVNDTAADDRTSQYRPQVAVSPAGRVDVLYYDRRDDPRDTFNEVSLQSSYDQGRTFTGRVRLSDRRFDSRIGFGEERGLADLGSRLALYAAPDASLGIWADTRASTEASGKQDLSLGVATFTSNVRGGTVLRVVGLLLALLGGLGAIISALMARRARGATAP